jgi:RNA polymerase sigma factor (sigma-70 family)
MPSGPFRAVLHYLRRAAAVPPAGEPTDRELLDRFAARRDGEAFAALLQRHGPMVWAVCRRVLRHEQDAEDAFQATFLVLARKAGAIARPERLANWLYGVAYRTALKARSEAARREARERQVAAMPAAEPPDELAWRDLGPVLGEEVHRLPERYRAPFVLCYLEGKTNEEAARQLGCPKGTVLSRLSWARQRLRSRLTRRGLAPSAGLLAAILSERAAPAAVPVGVAERTLKAAVLTAAAKTAAAGVVSTRVAALTEGVLRAMFLNQLKTAALVLALLILIGAGAGVFGYHVLAGEPADTSGADRPRVADTRKEKPKSAARSAERTRLLKAKADAAKAMWQARWQEFLTGRTTVDFLLPWSRHWLEAQLALSDNKADRVAAYQAHLDRMREAEKVTKAKFEAGQIAVSQYGQTTFHRLEAELWLLEARDQ